MLSGVEASSISYPLLMHSGFVARTFALQKTNDMKNVIALEELAMFALSIMGCYYLPVQFKWWVWPILFLLPDLGMIGYLISPEIGAITYNLFHYKLIAVVGFAIGFITGNNYVMLAGIILFGHSSMDRMLGYGLKLPDNFKHTHLGWM